MDKVDLPARAAKSVAPAAARRKASGSGTARKTVGVLVLGMHRSGTSALTRVLNLLGCALPSDLLGGNESNPEGHWESLRAIEINDTLLQALGRRWDDIRELPADWMQRPEAEVARTQIRGFLDKEFGAQKLWVLKDPRLCRLAPLWLEVMDEAGMDARIVVPVRHPGEVAYSLARRDGFSTGRSVLLWLQHVAEAERATRGRPRVLVHHHEFMANWRGEADSIRRELALTWPARGRNNTVIDEFVRPQLAHSNAQAGDPAATRVPLPAPVMRLYGEMLGNDDDKAWAAIERAANTIGKAASIFLPGIEDLSLRIEQRERETAAAMVALKAGVGDPEMWRRNSAALETLVKDNAVGFNRLSQSQPLLQELIRQIEAQRKEVGPLVKEQSHVLAALRAEARQSSGDLLGHVDGRLTDFGEYVQELRRQVAQLRSDTQETAGEVPPLVHEVIRQVEAQRNELRPVVQAHTDQISQLLEQNRQGIESLAQVHPLVHELIRQVEAQRAELGPSAQLPPLVHEVIGQLEAHRAELAPAAELPPLVHEVIRQLEAQRAALGELGPTAQLPPLVHEVIRQVEAQRTESRNQWQALSPTAELPPLVHEVIRQLEAQRQELGPQLQALAQAADAPALVHEVIRQIEAQRAEFAPAAQTPALVHEVLRQLEAQRAELAPAAESKDLVHEVLRQLEAQRAELAPAAESRDLVHEVIRQLQAQRAELGPAAQVPPLVQEVIAQLEAQRGEFGPLVGRLNDLLRKHGEDIGPQLQRQAQQMVQFADLLTQRDEQLQKLHEVAFGRQSQVAHMANQQTRLEQRIKALEREQATLEGLVAERDAALEAAATEHESTLAQHESALALRDGQFDRLADAHGALEARFERTDAERVARTAELADASDMLALAEQEIAAREVHARGLREALDLRTFEGRQLLQRNTELADHLAHVEHQVVVQAQQIEAHERHVAALEQTVTDAGRHIDGLRDILAERENRLADMHRTLEQSRRDLDEAREKIAQMTGSRSWKITAPLRAFNAMRRGGKPPGPATLVTEPFDRDWYLQTYPDVASSGMDPYQHYLMSGKAEGRKPLPPSMFARLAPGEDGDKPKAKKKGKAKPYVPRTEPLVTDDFDEAFYLRYYPDIAGSGVDPYDHFKSHGQAEGRFGKLPKLELTDGRIPFDPSRETVLVVSHEASRTGAPILSLNIGQGLARKYNVVSLLCGPGPMVDAFLQESTYVLGPVKLRDEYMKTMLLMEQLCAALPLKFAVVNSIESRHVLEHLGKFGVPTVSLIHEFAAYTRPRNAFRDAIYWAGETVFSTPLTCENALAEFPELADQSFNIAAQGRCLVHAEDADAESIEREDTRVRGRLRPMGERDDAIVVIGAGFVQQRKGVDLFIDIAAKVLASPGGRRFRFVWVGKGYDPENDLGYSVYLADQLRRHGLERDIVFLDETSRIDTVYAATDILLLSSRLDPLPNVAIDAMAHGLPVVCFENTTGIAGVLADAGLGESCVAAYLDTADMADKLLALGASPPLRAEIGAKSREVVAERFDMDRYLERLEQIAGDARERMQAELDGVDAIVSSGLVRKDFFYRPNHLKMPVEDVVRFAYLRAWSTGIGRRKLFPGFHPGVYGLHHALGRNDDALVDWLRRGRPDGPWLAPVVSNEDPVLPLPASARVALHLHVYYADLLTEMLGRIGDNRVRPDLFISVPNERVAGEVRETLADYAGRVVDIQVVPNRGRDIGPLLTAFGPALLDHYDYVGHLHTKKTADLKDESVGKNWYRFLLENLLGGKAPMADAVLGRLAADPTLGLVFPDDPNVVSWGDNRPYAQAVAGDLGVTELPEHFQLPVGTMFWARVEALRPIIEHGFQWSDYPAEPLPYDGSLLHALERLFPLVAEAHGYRNAVTNVTGVTR